MGIISIWSPLLQVRIVTIFYNSGGSTKGVLGEATGGVRPKFTVSIVLDVTILNVLDLTLAFLRSFYVVVRLFLMMISCKESEQ